MVGHSLWLRGGGGEGVVVGKGEGVVVEREWWYRDTGSATLETMGEAAAVGDSTFCKRSSA